MVRKPLVLSTEHRLSIDGAFADVFRSVDGSRAFKLFLRQPRCGEISLHADWRELMVRAVCKSECQAYERLKDRPSLTGHVPGYHGIRRVAEVLSDGKSGLASQYILDCCYELDYLEGECRKSAWIPEQDRPNASRLEEALNEAAVSNTGDSSYFYWEDPERIKIIDFGTHDAWGDLAHVIRTEGGLSAAHFQRHHGQLEA